MALIQNIWVPGRQIFSLFFRSAILSLSLWSGHGLAAVENIYAGTLEGEVHFTGQKPRPTVMKVVKDQDHCGTKVSIQTVRLHGAYGALSDAVVTVEGMSTNPKPEKAQRPVLNMRCAFSPRISVARKGQEVEVRNQDPILHNTHIKYGRRTFLNVAQVPSGKPIIKRLKKSGLHAIQCDKHVFMQAYLHVFSHPFYTLTNQTGTFQIPDIPPGTHTIRVWHETLGILKKVVKIPQKGTTRIQFTYP